MRRKNRFILILLSLISFSLSSPALDEKTEEQFSDRNKFTSLQKSLLFPGWGQLAEKRYIEGILFLSAEAFSLYKIFSYNHKGNKFYKKYKDADNVNDAIEYRELTEKYDKRRNVIIMAAVGIWIVNLIDTYVIVKGKKKKKLKLKLESGEDKRLVFTLSYSF